MYSHSIKSSDAGSLYLSATFTTSTTTNSAPAQQLTPLSGSVTFHQADTSYEPYVFTNADESINAMNSEMGTSGGSFVQIVDLTRDDDDTNSHKSDIPSQLPASATFLSNNSALVMLSQAGDDPVQNVHSPNRYQIRILGSYSILLHIFKWYLQFLDLRRNFAIGYTTSMTLNEQREKARRALLHHLG